MIAAKLAQWYETHQSLGSYPESYLAMAVKLSYTTLVTRSLQGNVNNVSNGWIFS